jgi:hypothetical protein
VIVPAGLSPPVTWAVSWTALPTMTELLAVVVRVGEALVTVKHSSLCSLLDEVSSSADAYRAPPA